MAKVTFPTGNHRGIISSQAFNDSEYGLQLVVGVFVEHEDGEQQRTVYLPLTDAEGQPAKTTDGTNLADKTLEVLKHLGLPGDRLSVLDPDHPEFFDLAGKHVELYCSHKMKEGNVFERWYINTPRAIQGKPADQKQLRRLDALFGKALKQKGKAATPATTEPQSDGGEPPADDDIPF